MPNFNHQPVLLQEVIKALKVSRGGIYGDWTVGGGGHAEAILAASSPTGWLYGFDRDGAAVEAAEAKLASFAGRFEIRRGNFAELGVELAAGSFDGVLLDLGVSSPQLDEAGRGFSFQQDGPLDMRMDTRQRLTAAELVNQSSADELANIFWQLGDETQSRRFARAIEHDRHSRPFTSTAQLAGLIERLAPRQGKRSHPATKVFQALRLAVNDEIGALRAGLAAGMRVLKPGGRLAVISFQSLEDRVVKEFGREQARDYEFDGPVDDPELRRPRQPLMKWVQRKAIKPGEAELAENPRSRSAQLRVLEKL